MSRIPQIHQVKVSTPWWQSQTVSFWGFALSVMALFPVGARGWTFAFIGLAILALALFVWLLLLSVVGKIEQVASYAAVLDKHPVEQVITASRSQEYSQESRDGMIVYLNGRHPGWSLGNTGAST